MQDQLPTEMQERPDRKDPRGFVMTLALALFAITLIAVLTMQLAL